MARFDAYSVLMSVYSREKPQYLRQAIDSMFRQTVCTDDFVLVCDGPLTDELEEVVYHMQDQYGDVFHVVRLEKNSGLGNALNVGMEFCKYEMIARMDSDDISYPDRCERQLAEFDRDPGLSVVSGTIQEFTSSPEKINAWRVLPNTQAGILNFAKRRNPFNHPCVMYRKSAVKNAGGYQDFYLLEDYYLWIRMLLIGCQGYNIREPLLWMRAGSDMYRRRAGWKYARSQMQLFSYMERQGFISRSECIRSSLIRAASSIAPNQVRESVFQRLLRTGDGGTEDKM